MKTLKHEWTNTIHAVVILFSCLCIFCFTTGSLPAQEAEVIENESVGKLKLRIQGEIPLTDFIDYVSQRLGVRVLYDESIRLKRVNLIAPDPIPLESLPEILQSVLINEELVVTDADDQGFRRVTTNNKIPQVARTSDPTESLKSIEAAVPVTRIFVLKEAKPTEISELVRPFLSSLGASVTALDRNGLLIVTDIARNVRRAEQLIQILDGEQTQIDVEFVPAEHVDASTLSNQLTEILKAKRKALGGSEENVAGIEVSVDERTNSIILVGTRTEIKKTISLLKKLDRALRTQEATYNLRFFSPSGFDETVRNIVQGQSPNPPYQSRVEGNALIVNSTPEVLKLIERTQQQLDTREAPADQSPVRFYKIKNVPAQELIETIRGIGANVSGSAPRERLPSRRRTSNDLAVPGPNLSPLLRPGLAQPVQVPLTPPAFRADDPATTPGQQTGRLRRNENEFLPPGNALSTTLEEREGNGPEMDDELASRVGSAQVTVDIHTNTIIVVAAPEVQRIYASLIEELDERRPQVLVEAEIVIVDTSDEYTLGVEVSGGDRAGAKRLFSFSSFGLSTVDPVSGALSILPGVGFNGTLVDPSTADVVVRALANHRRARVLSTPKILVNDNAEGQLTSVLEVPFTSVNASQTVATTSFAGFAEAGTTITVTPTISEDNYLQLDYIVTLNSFTGAGSDGVPPPRQTNEIRSRVTVPDGYTVIVGGLTSKNDSYEIDTIPILERIPIVRDIAGLQQENGQQTSLFVFLKPIILREDKFKDLRFLSDVELRTAELPTNFPSNEPLMVR